LQPPENFAPTLIAFFCKVGAQTSVNRAVKNTPKIFSLGLQKWFSILASLGVACQPRRLPRAGSTCWRESACRFRGDTVYHPQKRTRNTIVHPKIHRHQSPGSGGGERIPESTSPFRT